jgi:DNA repair exonuclease SbcCD ATPase subunit
MLDAGSEVPINLFTPVEAKKQIKELLNCYAAEFFTKHPYWNNLVKKITTKIDRYEIQDLDVFKNWLQKTLIPQFTVWLPALRKEPELKGLRKQLLEAIATWPSNQQMLENIIAAQNVQINQFTLWHKALMSDIENYQTQIAQLSPEAHQALLGELEGSRAYTAELLTQLEATEQAHAENTEKLAQSDQVLSKANEDFARREEALNAQVTAFTTKVSEKDLEIRGLKEQLLLATQSSKSLTAVLQQKNTLVMEYRNSIVTLTADTDRMKALISQLSTAPLHHAPSTTPANWPNATTVQVVPAHSNVQPLFPENNRYSPTFNPKGRNNDNSQGRNDVFRTPILPTVNNRTPNSRPNV